MGGFSDSIGRFNEKTHKSLEDVTRKAFLLLSSRVVRRTPVLSGRLRANWQTGLNSMPSGTVDSTSGSLAMASAANKAKGLIIGSRLYLMNNLPYAKVIEEGHSTTKAPQGMVRISVAEWKNIVELAARAVKK